MKITKIVTIVLAAVVGLFFVIRYTQKQFFEDTVPPVLSCDSQVLEVSVKSDRDKLLSGVTAIDDKDGDISDSIYIKSISKLVGKNTAKISYIVFDSSDNMATLSRTIRYTDYQKTHFTLTKPLIYNIGETITLKDRIIATDDIDGDLTNAIKVTTSALSNSSMGVYHITIQVSNSLGDTSMLPLPITIYSPSQYDPYIILTNTLVYIEKGSDFEPIDYISSISEKRYEDKPITDYDKVRIENTVNTEVSGVYDVTYIYTNDEGYSYRAILTVVVE